MRNIQQADRCMPQPLLLLLLQIPPTLPVKDPVQQLEQLCQLLLFPPHQQLVC
jgi:hypothetical protein